MSGISIKLTHSQIAAALESNGIDSGKFDKDAAIHHLFINISSGKRDILAKFISRARKRSLLSEPKLINLMYFVYLLRNLNGNILEVGTYKGGSAYAICALISYLQLNTKFVTVDTFNGFGNELLGSEMKLKDKFTDGSCAAVVELLKDFNFATVKESSIEEYGKQIDAPVKLMHIDSDSYTSTKVCLQIASKWLVKDGIIVIDDVNSSKSPMVRVAVTEFLENESARTNPYLLLPTNRDQSIIIKK